MSNETTLKTFDTPTLASIATGVLLVQPFSKVHEACEWLLGHPVWTHELGSKATVERIKAALVAQFPEFGTIDAANVGKDNWAPFAYELIENLGPSREIARGSQEREADPITTLWQMRPDAEIIVASLEDAER